MKIAKMNPPVNGISTAFIAGDWHTDALNMPTYNILKAHAMTLPPEMRNLIINGDFLDAPHIMPRNPMYKKWIKRSDGMDDYFVPESEKEFEWGNKILDDLSTVFNEIIFIYGNHDWRYDEMMGVSPAYAHNFDLKAQLKLSERKIDYVEANDWLDWGNDLAITHGMYHSPASCHKRHYEASRGKNVIFSHVHYYGCKAFIVRGNTIQAWSLPAMCDLNPHYIKNRENNWSNGYGMINMRPDSSFNFNVFQVWDDKLVLPTGMILDGRKE